VNMRKRYMSAALFAILVGLAALYEPALAAVKLEALAGERFAQAIILFTGSSQAFVNNVESRLDAQPQIKNSRTLVPVRFISESLGAQVEYDGVSRVVCINLGDKKVQLQLGSREMTVNGVLSSLDVAAESINNRTFIPLRALIEALGKKVFYYNSLIVISDDEEILNTNDDRSLINNVIALLDTQATPGAAPAVSAADPLQLEKYDGGFFSMERPAGWEVITAGSGSTLSFLVRDPGRVGRQIFYFGEAGPVYLLAEQRAVDQSYMNMGGYPVQWIDTAVVDPLTPENFLQQFHQLMATKFCQSFMPKMSLLNDVEIVSVKPVATPFAGGQAAVIRAFFRENGQLCEGLFSVTAAPLIPYAKLPGGGIGYGFMFTGITAPKDDFNGIEEQLLKSLESLKLSEEYVRQCQAGQQATWKAIFETGQILNSTSDTIMDVWENRTKSEDILAEKRSDAILGRERLYDPDTGRVYEFNNGFYDSYNSSRARYDLSGLLLLPADDHSLWTTAPLNGYAHLR